jgi:chromosome segregation ATPase|tara:strand:+ start:143 stop:340 length:198 start_codon:yes stop_codon:yes gene_type:complete
MVHIEKLQQQIDEQLVELADLREQLSHEKLVNETREEYLNQLQKEIEDLIKTLKGQPRKDVVNNG